MFTIGAPECPLVQVYFNRYFLKRINKCFMHSYLVVVQTIVWQPWIASCSNYSVLNRSELYELRVFSWRLKSGGRVATLVELLTLGIQFFRFEDLKTELFSQLWHKISDVLKTEDFKTGSLKSEDLKYAFMCWKPQNWDCKSNATC